MSEHFLLQASVSPSASLRRTLVQHNFIHPHKFIMEMITSAKWKGNLFLLNYLSFPGAY